MSKGEREREREREGEEEVGRGNIDSRACGETDKEAWEGNGGVSAGKFAGKCQRSRRWSSSKGRNELYSRFLELVEIFCFWFLVFGFFFFFLHSNVAY
jgi:hypothetical protein